MSDQPELSRTALLDEWIADVGEEAVALTVFTIRRGVADGVVPGFSDKASLLRYWSHGRRQSA